MRLSARVRRGCAAVGCLLYVEANAFMCGVHLAWLPDANKAELRESFESWAHRGASRQKYLAARIRAIVAVAALERRTVPAALTSVLEKLDTGEWL
ncbi:MAG: hypothetical protein ACYCPO_06605 [Acidobacteriaceae bacterium]